MKKTIELSGYSLIQREKIAYQSKLVEYLEGEWFDLENGVQANHYFGVNQLTDLKESYTNIYVDSIENLIDIESEIKNIINKRVRSTDFDWSHIEVIYRSNTLKNNKVTYKFIEHSLYSTPICKHISSKGLIKPDFQLSNGIILRTGHSSDESDIIKSLITAHFNGLHKDMKEQIKEKTLVNNIKALYTPFFHESRQVFIAELNKKFIGHGSIESSFSIINPNMKIANLIDILVLDKFRDMGIAKYLSKIIEFYCANENISFLSGTVETDDDFIKYERTLSALFSEDWEISSFIYSKKLSEDK